MKWSRNTALCSLSFSSRTTIVSSVSPFYQRIASTSTSSAANSIVLYPFYRLFHLSLSYHQESVLLARKAAKNSPVIESILCKPISGPGLSKRIPPSLRFPLSHRNSYHPLPFCHLRSLICRRRKVLSTPASPFPPPFHSPALSFVIDLCANIEPRRRGREWKWERPDEMVQEKREEWGKGTSKERRGFNRGWREWRTRRERRKQIESANFPSRMNLMG